MVLKSFCQIIILPIRDLHGRQIGEKSSTIFCQCLALSAPMDVLSFQNGGVRVNGDVVDKEYIKVAA